MSVPNETFGLKTNHTIQSRYFPTFASWVSFKMLARCLSPYCIQAHLKVKYFTVIWLNGLQPFSSAIQHQSHNYYYILTMFRLVFKMFFVSLLNKMCLKTRVWTCVTFE